VSYFALSNALNAGIYVETEQTRTRELYTVILPHNNLLVCLGPCGKTDVPVFLAEECSVVEEMQHVFRMYFTQVRSAVLSLLHTDRRTDTFIPSVPFISSATNQPKQDVTNASI